MSEDATLQRAASRSAAPDACAATRGSARRVVLLAARGVIAADGGLLCGLLASVGVLTMFLGELEQGAALPAPPAGAAGVALGALVAGWIAGVVKVERERGVGTLAYLVHRERLALAWAAKGVACAAAAFLAACVPVAIAWARADGIQVGALLFACAAALPGAGLGAVSATWREPRAVRLALGLFALLGLARGLDAWLAFGGLPRDVAWLVYAAGCALIGGGAWELAGRRLAAVEDDERAPRGVAGVLSAVIAVVLIVPPLRWIASGAQDYARDRVLSCALRLVPEQDRPEGLPPFVGVHVDVPPRWWSWIFDEDRPMASSPCRAVESNARIAAELARLRSGAGVDRGLPSADAPFGRLVALAREPGPWTFAHAWPTVRAWLDRGSGRIVAADGAVLAEGLPRDAAVLLADSAEGEEGGAVLIADVATGATWRFAEAGPEHLVPVSLPGGARLTGLEPEVRGSAYGGFAVRRLLLASGDALWTWTAAGDFAPVDRAADVRTGRDLELGRGAPRPRLADADRLAPRIVVVDPASGRTLFEHAHPSEWRRPLAAAIAHAASVARGPVAAVRGFASDADPDLARGSVWLDPLLVGGRRPGLLGAHVAVAVLLGVWIVRRVGAGLRGALWCLVLIACGPLTVLPLAIVEPARRRARAAAAHARNQWT